MLDTIARFQFFIYPLVVHLSVIYQVPFITACLLPLFYFILVRPFSDADSHPDNSGLGEGNADKHRAEETFFYSRSLWTVKSGIFFLLCLIALFSYFAIDHSIIYLPPILMISLILYPFARSVTPGKTPLLSRFHQLAEKDNNPQVMEYTKNVTWVWVMLIALMLFNTLALTFFAPLEIWSLFTNIINYALMLALFVIEWLFRMLWFKHWFSPIRFITQLMSIDQRELLR